jgi:UbiD family decarboxylase
MGNTVEKHKSSEAKIVPEDSKATEAMLTTIAVTDTGPPFDKPFGNGSGIVFEVQDRPVFVSKPVVCSNSPVFNAMFNGDFSEKDETTITLPDDLYDDFVYLMTIIHPPRRLHTLTSKMMSIR